MLTIENGIIQNDHIFGVPFVRAIVSDPGAPNVRPRLPMTHILGITNHNTGNPRASARDHAQWLANVAREDRAYVSVHFFVDHEVIVQTVPINETTWHAGDGQGPGNLHTVSVEICENPPYARAEANAVCLNAALILTHPEWRIYKHQDWNGKYCPHLILDRPNGWADFLAAIQARAAEARRPATPPPDNSPSDWAAEAVAWAEKRALIRGDEQGNWHLHRAATREEVLVFMHRYHQGGAQ